MKHKQDKRDDDKRNYKAMWFVAKEMKEYYKEGMETGLSELRYQLLVRDTLLWVIDEVVAMTTDPLAKKVLLLVKEREALDRLIHIRTILWPK